MVIMKNIVDQHVREFIQLTLLAMNQRAKWWCSYILAKQDGL